MFSEKGEGEETREEKGVERMKREGGCYAC